MKPKRIILIRHGESEGNIDNSVYEHKPDYALELTKTGLEQAYQAGFELKSLIKNESAFFYVSPLWRNRMTFEQIAKHFDKEKIKWTEEPRLRAQEWGHLKNFEDLIETDKERDAFGIFYYRISNGESAADVYDRVSDFLGTLHRDFEKETYPENAVIISHGMTTRLFLMRWYHWTVEQFEEYANPQNCQIIILEKNSLDKYDLKTELRKRKVTHNFQRPIKLV
jgi:broad specificity phosphatase PhoE